MNAGPVNTGPAPAGTGGRRVRRAAVAALSRALPAHFRARQHAEWTADLLVLADQPTAAWIRYLLGAAWTLPALRRAAQRAAADGTAVVLPSSGLVARLTARVLMLSLGWTVPCWLLALPGQYLLYDIPGRRAAGMAEPTLIWSGGPVWLQVVGVVLYLGAATAVYDGPLLVLCALVAVVLLAFERGLTAYDRIRWAALIAGAAVSSGLIYLLVTFRLELGWTGGGPVLPTAGLVALGLSAGGRGLSRPTRVALAALGLAAVAVAVIDPTVGLDMVVWFWD